jgi:putative colanic acid biosynthesis acetyltransferase WcaF
MLLLASLFETLNSLPMSQPNIHDNRSAVKYARSEMAWRILWGIGHWFFLHSPRPLFGFRRWLLRLFGAKVGQDVNIYPSSHIYYPWNLEIGDWSCIGEWTLVYNLGRVTIGERVTISQRVHLCAGTHDYQVANMPLLKLPITIEDNVWVCADAFIGPNIKIGKDAVVGARSVVVKDVPPSVVVGGNPARVIKKRVAK